MGGKLSKIIRTFYKIDLSFYGHVKVICKKVFQNLYAIARLANISGHMRQILIKSFFES